MTADALRKTCDTAFFYAIAMDYIQRKAPDLWKEAMQHALNKNESWRLFEPPTTKERKE
jgi:hypothetical protein